MRTVTSKDSEMLLIQFKAISNFTTCLGEVFGKKQKSLKLYAHLISRTTLAHEKPIAKHIEAFKVFCTANREAIAEKVPSKLVKNRIIYSQRVFIDMAEIFSWADQETGRIIWKHLLTIAALVDPTGKARQILKESSKKGTAGTEADFLTNIIGKVEEHVDPEANPMEAVASIMQSGVFTELVGGMGNGLQDGSLDLGKLMGTVQNMVTGLSAQATPGTEGGDAADMISTMMGSLNAGAAPGGDGAQGAPPDLSGMLSMMGPMLGALSGPEGGSGGGGSITEQIEAQVEEAKKTGALPDAQAKNS